MQNLHNNFDLSSITNTGSINELNNASNITITTLTNQTNGRITTLNNSGTFTTLNNQSTIDTLTNLTDATLTTLNNTGTITTLDNEAQGSITSLNNQANGNIATLINAGTIGTAGATTTNQGSITQLENTGTIYQLTNANGGNIATILNNGTLTGGLTNQEGGSIGTFTHASTTVLDSLTNIGSMDTINNQNAQITAITNQTGTTTHGSINNLNNQNAQITTLTNQANTQITNLNNSNSTLTTLNNTGTITTLSNADNSILTALNNQANALITTLNNTTGSTLTTLTNNANAQITNLNNSAILTTLNNQANATIDTLSNFDTLTTLTNAGNIATLNNTNNATLTTLTNSGNINQLNNIANATLTTLNNQTNAQIQELNNNAGLLNALTNAGTIDNLNNTNNATLTTLTNNSEITNLNNAARVITLDNEANAQIQRLNNSGILTTLTNKTNAQITTLSNSGTLNTLHNQTAATLETLENTNNITTLENQAGSTLTTLNNNTGTISTLNNAGTLTTLNNNANITTLTNTGTLTTLSNGAFISNLTQNTANALTYSTNQDGYVHTLDLQSGSITINDELYIGRNRHKQGTLATGASIINALGRQGSNQVKEGALTIATNSTINAQDKTISVYGTLNNQGTIQVGELILTRGISNPQALLAQYSGSHINGTINNSNNNGSNITLQNWVLELTQVASDYNDKTKAKDADTKGHIIMDKNVTIGNLKTGTRFGADGSSVLDREAGILIIADTDKWEEKYNYEALFLKNDNGALTTALKEIRNLDGEIVNKTDQYGKETQTKAENLGGEATLSIQALRNLYTPQSTVKIIDLQDGFAVGLEPKGSPSETLSTILLNGAIANNLLISNLIDSMSRRMFHKSLEHRKGQTYSVMSKSVDEQGKRVKDKNDILVPLAYNNIDMLQEADMIYSPHAANSSYQAFFLPLSRYTTSKLEGGFSGNEFIAGALMGGFLNLKSHGSLGFYAGYESGHGTIGRSDGNAKIKHSNVLAGLHYYKTFYTKDMREYYFKAIFHAQNQRPDFEVYRSIAGDSAVDKISAFGIDAEMRLGATLYNVFKNSALSPEVGLGYGLLHIAPFSLTYESTVLQNETFPAHSFHIPYVHAKVRYIKAFANNKRYSILLGGRYNIDSVHSASVQIGDFKASSSFNVPALVGLAGASFSYSLGKRSEIAAQLDGAFSVWQLSGSLSVRYSVWW
ncbi:beta strand repeat-containing protein [Helicobacter himalayensis]|nr:hypothetical protein [Helicobacter himalayensis]